MQFFFFFAFFLNDAIICIGISNHRTPINYLLVNLAIADILYAMFVAPKVFFKLTLIHPEGMIGTILCKLLTGGTVAWVGGVSSIVTLVAIAIERHYAVIYPFGHKRKLTKAKLKVRHKN